MKSLAVVGLDEQARGTECTVSASAVIQTPECDLHPRRAIVLCHECDQNNAGLRGLRLLRINKHVVASAWLLSFPIVYRGYIVKARLSCGNRYQVSSTCCCFHGCVACSSAPMRILRSRSRLLAKCLWNLTKRNETKKHEQACFSLFFYRSE